VRASICLGRPNHIVKTLLLKAHLLSVPAFEKSDTVPATRKRFSCGNQLVISLGQASHYVTVFRAKKICSVKKKLQTVIGIYFMGYW